MIYKAPSDHQEGKTFDVEATYGTVLIHFHEYIGYITEILTNGERIMNICERCEGILHFMEI